MTEVRLVDEHVHLAVVALVPEEEAAVTVEHVELAIADVPERFDQLDHTLPGGPGSHQVDVRVLPLQRRPAAAGTENGNGDAAENPQRQAALGSSLADPRCLGNGIR